MTKKFDPNAAAPAHSGIFGLPYGEAESALVYLPVPWEATTSYGGGTSNAPAAIFQASHQVDLYDLDVQRPYEAGLYMLAASDEIVAWNRRARVEAEKVIAAGGVVEGDPGLVRALEIVNSLGEELNACVRAETRRLLAAGKIVGVVGGDHSVPYGALQAIAEKHPSFGILHFDAHSDTRDAYQGFRWSHASIMNNVLREIPEARKLVQVGIRDVCEQEVDFVRAQGARVDVWYDRDIQRRKLEGTSWATIAKEAIQPLPHDVWVSFDIDGLDPRFCPHTGTPVPGGLDLAEANYLLSLLVRSGRRIIGFDLNEVAPSPDANDEWDANVGARLLYKLSAWTLASQGRAMLLA